MDIKKLKKGFIGKSTILLLGAALFLAGCGDKKEAVSSTQAIKDRGVIRIAVFSDKPPFGYVDGKGQPQGYDIVLAKRLAKDLLGDESKIEYVYTEAQNRVDVLKSDKVDVTLANFTVTPERAEQVDFADPYMKTAIGVVSSSGEPIKNIDDLKGKVLIVNKGTTAEIYFTEHYPEIKQLKFDHNTEAFSALKDGRGAALAHDNTLLFAWVKENPAYQVSIEQIGPVDFIAPAVKKGNTELKEWINSELNTLKDENFFHKNFEQTIKPFYGEGINPDSIVIDRNQ